MFLPACSAVVKRVLEAWREEKADEGIGMSLGGR